MYIPEEKRHLHPQSKKTFTSPKKKTFTSPKQKDVYILEAKRHLHPRSKNTFTSPKQRDVYIPEKKTFTSPKQKDIYIPEAKKSFTFPKQKRQLHPRRLLHPWKIDVSIPEKNKFFLKFGSTFIFDLINLSFSAQVSNLAPFLEDLRHSEKLWD